VHSDRPSIREARCFSPRPGKVTRAKPLPCHLHRHVPLEWRKQILDMPPFSRPFRPGPHAATMVGVLHSLSRHHYSNSLMYSHSLWYPMVPSCQKSLASFTALGTGCTSYHYASVIILISARNPMQSRKCPQMDLAAFSAFPLPIIIVSSTFSTSIVTQNLPIQMLEAEAATWPPESLESVPASHITSMQGPTVLLDRTFPGVAVLQVEQLSGPIHRLRGATLVVQVKPISMRKLSRHHDHLPIVFIVYTERS
jgi:hypothetical protein